MKIIKPYIVCVLALILNGCAVIGGGSAITPGYQGKIEKVDVIVNTNDSGKNIVIKDELDSNNFSGFGSLVKKSLKEKSPNIFSSESKSSSTHKLYIQAIQATRAQLLGAPVSVYFVASLQDVKTNKTAWKMNLYVNGGGMVQGEFNQHKADEFADKILSTLKKDGILP